MGRNKQEAKGPAGDQERTRLVFLIVGFRLRVPSDLLLLSYHMPAALLLHVYRRRKKTVIICKNKRKKKQYLFDRTNTCIHLELLDFDYLCRWVFEHRATGTLSSTSVHSPFGSVCPSSRCEM